MNPAKLDYEITKVNWRIIFEIFVIRKRADFTTVSHCIFGNLAAGQS